MLSSEGKLFGVREVYRPAESEAAVDIVAVHGLNGDAIHTWTSTKDKICWLSHKEFLSKYVPNARVLVWSYNAGVASITGQTPSKDRIHHHAQTLIAELYADRRLERRVEKPIIFLCHSLGGIIVKRALSYSSSRSSDRVAHISSIFGCTYGIMFFGTPHNGSSKARLLSTLQKIASATVPQKLGQFESELLPALEQESETLQNITDYFVPLMKHFQIYFFWEQEKMDLKYKKDYIVDSESAAPSFDNVERSGIAANHSTMVKFNDNKSQGFRTVMAALDRYCEDAPRTIERRVQASKQSQYNERREEALELLSRLQPPGFVADISYTSSNFHKIQAPTQEIHYTPAWLQQRPHEQVGIHKS